MPPERTAAVVAAATPVNDAMSVSLGSLFMIVRPLALGAERG